MPLAMKAGTDTSPLRCLPGISQLQSAWRASVTGTTVLGPHSRRRPSYTIFDGLPL